MIRYAPGCRAANKYTPAWFVFTVEETPVFVFCAVTAARGTAAPLGSVTAPETTASVLWPFARPFRRRHTTSTTAGDLRLMFLKDPGRNVRRPRRSGQ